MKQTKHSRDASASEFFTPSYGGPSPRGTNGPTAITAPRETGTHRRSAHYASGRIVPMRRRGFMELTNKLDASLTEDSRYRLLVEAVTDYAIYMLDRNGIGSSWNPGAQHFKGYTANEIIGQHFSRFYTEEDQRSGLPERALEPPG